MPEPNEQPHDTNSDPENITEERAARRFHQIRHRDSNLVKLEKRIHDTAERLKTLKEQRVAQIEALREAARDEGDLPLFADLD